MSKVEAENYARQTMLCLAGLYGYMGNEVNKDVGGVRSELRQLAANSYMAGWLAHAIVLQQGQAVTDHFVVVSAYVKQAGIENVLLQIQNKSFYDQFGKFVDVQAPVASVPTDEHKNIYADGQAANFDKLTYEQRVALQQKTIADDLREGARTVSLSNERIREEALKAVKRAIEAKHDEDASTKDER